MLRVEPSQNGTICATGLSTSQPSQGNTVIRIILEVEIFNSRPKATPKHALTPNPDGKAQSLF